MVDVIFRHGKFVQDRVGWFCFVLVVRLAKLRNNLLSRASSFGSVGLSLDLFGCFWICRDERKM